MKKVNHIGYLFLHRFKRQDGSTFETETTEADYRQLANKNPDNPTSADGVWVCSYQTPKFDTPNGRLSDGEFCVLESEGGNILAKEAGQNRLTFLKQSDFSDIEKGELKLAKIL